MTAGPLLLIDAHNKAAGYARSTAEARRAVAAGTAATWAAIPRHGVTALDLDMREGLSWLVADTITSWCRTRGLWWLLRESGRAGHLHLWVLTLDHGDELEDLADRIRAEFRLSRPQLDVRSRGYMRPPSAPHRSGAPALADQLTAEHLADLLARIGGRPRAARHRPTKNTRAAAEVAEYAARRAPLRRRRSTSADVAQETTGDRSRDEFDATLAAYNAGQSADEAWQQVAARDGHSAARGRRWWQRCMWDQIRAAHGTGRAGLHDAAARSLPAIRARLAALPHLDARAAQSLDAVLWVLGELVATGTTPTPVSVRDLEGATGLATDTVCRALARAEAAQLVVRHVSHRPDDAHAWTWGEAARAVHDVVGTPCLTPAAARWLHTLPRGSPTALALHLAGQPVPAKLAPALAAILAVVAQPTAPEPVECPAWPRIRAERDGYHERIRASRAAYAAQWQADRAAAHRRDRAHALAWQREHLARARAERPQPLLPRLDCLPTAPRGRVMWTARATAPARPAHSARSDHRPARRPVHPHALASSGDPWTAPRTAPWTASAPAETPPPGTTDPHGRQQPAP